MDIRSSYCACDLCYDASFDHVHAIEFHSQGRSLASDCHSNSELHADFVVVRLHVLGRVLIE